MVTVSEQVFRLVKKTMHIRKPQVGGKYLDSSSKFFDYHKTVGISFQRE
jgi:hypothetical protein